MLFCPKCGSVMRPEKGRLECSKCKHRVEGELKLHTSFARPETNVGVVEKEEQVLPKTQEECPKCRHHEAYYWLVQTRAADEAATKFLRCCRCGHTWRDYG